MGPNPTLWFVPLPEVLKFIQICTVCNNFFLCIPEEKSNTLNYLCLFHCFHAEDCTPACQQMALFIIKRCDLYCRQISWVELKNECKSVWSSMQTCLMNWHIRHSGWLASSRFHSTVKFWSSQERKKSVLENTRCLKQYVCLLKLYWNYVSKGIRKWFFFYITNDQIMNRYDLQSETEAWSSFRELDWW